MVRSENWSHRIGFIFFLRHTEDVRMIGVHLTDSLGTSVALAQGLLLHAPSGMLPWEKRNTSPLVLLGMAGSVTGLRGEVSSSLDGPRLMFSVFFY
jgi:hypothetical protein